MGFFYLGFCTADIQNKPVYLLFEPTISVQIPADVYQKQENK